MDDKKRRDTEEQEAEETAGEILEGDIDNERTDTKEVESLRNEAAKWEDSYKRALADYQNLQRRTLDEKREWARLSNKEFILKILPILDTLVLAEKHTKDQNFVLVVQQFLSALEQEGVTKIKTIGEEFNPHTMEAVATSEGEAGKVVEEARAGYMFYDSVLRPAQVVVGA